MIKTLIFDFDGTLADTCPLIVATMQQTIRQLGLPSRTDRECASMIGLPLRQTFSRLIPMDDAMAELCDKTYTEIFQKSNTGAAVPLFPGVEATLRRFHSEGFTLAIASSRRRTSLLDFVEGFGLEDCISCVVSSSDVANAKPHPEMVTKILRQTSTLPGEALVVGDTCYDVEMGRRAGTHTCAVSYGNGMEEELVEADYIVDSFGKVKDVVDDIMRQGRP